MNFKTSFTHDCLTLLFVAEEHVAQIDKAIQLIQQATCVRFIARTDEEDYVTFTGDSLHCSSMVGREGGEQFIKLTKDDAVGEGCFQIGSVMHEIMHALGFYHMHKSPERDDFITIMWDNIDKGDHSKLDKREDEEDLTNFGLGYDFDSIMHYSSKLYSINDEDTLVAANPEDTLRMGQREWLSDGDILRIRRMYNCWGQEAVERMTEKEEFATRTSQHYSGLSDTTLTVGQETSIATSSTSENIEQKPEPTNSSIEPELSNLV